VNRFNGQSNILHFKHFHPLHDYYGMSPMEAAAYSIDQHNQAARWNQALLQNGAKPSGALVIKTAADGSGGMLSDEQYSRIKSQVDDQYSGAINAGRPMLLEGGMDWKEMSLSPRDMDFIESKHSSARDIALAFGVPPQLLGIPGDNTYSNLVEARLALWEQTILPMMEHIAGCLNLWLTPHFGEGLRLEYDTESISALAPRREKIWTRVNEATFLSDEEKRKILGIGVE
jgi:HK97 family phage portal protein